MTESLYDKILNREKLTNLEFDYMKLLIKESKDGLNEQEQDILDVLNEEDDFILDFNESYFKDLNERNLVLARLKYKELIDKDAFNLQDLDFSKREVRQRFIRNTESGLFLGKDYEGREVIVTVERNIGMSVVHLNIKGWYEGYEYNSQGLRLCEILEKREL